MDMRLVNVRTDNERIFALREAHCQLATQSICFLRSDLAGDKGLPHVIGNYVVLASASPRLLFIHFLGKKKLCIGKSAVTLIAGDQLKTVCLIRVFNVFDNIADRRADAPAFPGVQRDQTGCCHNQASSSSSLSFL